MFERYIGIDNVCAWPNLTRLPDGAITTAIFNQPTHGGWEGDVECWASEDEGYTWRLRGVPAKHEPGTNRMNVAAGCGHDGRLIVLASGWSNRNPIGFYSSPHEGAVLPIWVCISRDGGETWTQEGSVALPSHSDSRLIPFGDIIKLGENALGVCVYGWSQPGKHSAYFYLSLDDGITWALQGRIQNGNTNETAPLACPDGRLLVAARTLGDEHLEIFESTDEGKTWVAMGPATLGFQHPGHLLRLYDGKLLLTYGIRNKGLYGVGARLSLDGGAKWEPPSVLVDFKIATDGGYPSSVQCEDGIIVTAYYCNRIPAHQRYHMGVIRWRTESN